MKRTFEMKGKSYNTLTAIAKELGVKRVYVRDFVKFGITETTETDVAISKSVNILDDVTDVQDDNQDSSDDEKVIDDEEVIDDDQDTVKKIASNPLTTGGSAIIFAHNTANGISVDKVIDIPAKTDLIDDIQDDNQDSSEEEVILQNDQNEDSQEETDQVISVTSTPQTEEEKIAQIERDVVDYTDVNELVKNVRKISLNGLIKMVENIQGDLWERISNEGIRKMRLIMELKKGYFPESQPTKIHLSSNSSSGPSPWKKISTADLQSAAASRNLTWKDCSNDGILRMRLIMVLKKAGVTADELQG